MSGGTSSDGVAGQWGPTDDSSPFNATAFMIRQMLAKVSTATLVRVEAVTSAGEVAEPGTVDVLPLVNLLDGAGNATEHGKIYKLPYLRLQGGTNAVILDPVAGDIGIAVFADRDISSVRENKGPSNPGSRRRFDMADGIYIGGVLGATPEQYVRFTATGVIMADKNGHKIEMKSGSIEITGNVKIVGTLETTAAATFDAAVEVKGATTLDQTLDVKGASTLESGAAVTGNVSTTGTLSAGGAVSGATVAATTGNVTAAQNIVAGASLLGGDMIITGHVAYTVHVHTYDRPGAGPVIPGTLTGAPN